MSSCRLLQRVLSHNIELASKLVGVELEKVVIQGQAVACDATAHNCCVGGEERSYIGSILVQVERTCRCHPLVEVCHNLLRRGAHSLGIRCDNHTCGIAEQHGLYIVPLTRQRVYIIVLPKLREDSVLLREERLKVDKNCDRTTLDIPTANTHTHALIVERLTPSSHQ